eukprot:3846697-Rhodomonas_salina.1
MPRTLYWTLAVQTARIAVASFGFRTCTAGFGRGARRRVRARPEQTLSKTISVVLVVAVDFALRKPLDFGLRRLSLERKSWRKWRVGLQARGTP